MLALTQILVVDDDPIVLSAYRFVLDRFGTVHGAGTVEAAQHALDTGPVDIALLDFDLPDGTGIDLLHHIHARGLPTVGILLTGHVDPEIARRACRYQTAGYLQKPAGPMEIQAVVRRALQMRKRKGGPRRAIPKIEKATQLLATALLELTRIG